jgi:pilus assembly protein CpaB
MNWKTVTPLVIALCLGTVAAVVGRGMMAKGRQGGAPSVGMSRVVVARADLAPGAVIRETDVSVREMPSAGLPTGLALGDLREVIGRVVTTPIVKDQVVLGTLLAPKGSGGGLGAMVPAGMRAVTIEVNEFSGLGGLLTPGARVDVVQTIDGKGDGSGKVSRTIVENLRVLAVGRRTSQAATPPGGAGEPDSTNLAKSVTLLATAGQAEAIDLASHVGTPRLVLRNGSDERLTGGPGTTVSELLGGGGGRGSSGEATGPRAWDVLGTALELLRNSSASTRPVQLATELPVAARRNYREVEVIRGGTSTSVKVEAGGDGGLDVVGGGDQLDRVVPSDR